jgi:diguanylate cyclase (GGDEF)-like protein/PAS domain S-box-containing protein
MVFGRLSIRTKLAIVMTLLLAIISVAVYVYFPARLKQQALDSMVQNGTVLAEMTSFSMARGLNARDPAAVAEVLTAMRRNPDIVYVVVFDARGTVYAGFNELMASQMSFRSIPMKRVQTVSSLPGAAVPQEVGSLGSEGHQVSGGFSSDGSVYQALAPVRYQGRLIGQLYLGLSLEGINASIVRSKATVALVTAVAFMVGVIGVIVLSTLITEPLQRIVNTAGQIAEGDLSRRADVHGGDEVGQVAVAFNLMIDRVHAAWRELEEWGRTLELRVSERTRELKDEVDERRRAEEALRLSEEQYRLLIERNLAGVYIASEDGRIVSCNEACARIFGHDSRDQFLTGTATVPYRHRRDRDSIMRRLYLDGTVMNEEVELSDGGGRSIWVLENIRLVAAKDDAPASLEGIVLDITDRKQSEADIAFKAYHDLLTGLPNRDLFLDRLRVVLQHAQRQESNLAVLFLDVDNMKGINDTLGHDTGDKLLRMFGERLSSTLRGGDTVARVGGDEFLILLSHIHSGHDAEAVAAKIRDRVSEVFLVEEDEMHITMSIGVAVFPTDGTTPEELIRNADGAMYRIKESGGDGFDLCTQIGKTGLGRLSLEKEIRAGLEREEFVAYYQPQVKLSTGLLSGVEALVRWNHPNRSVVEPAGFITVAEQTGLIALMGEAVLRQACLQMVAWQAAGTAPPRISVNVSARQFHQRDFIGLIERILVETQCDPARLELEITESVAVQKTDRSLRMLRRFREMGITIAVDDFGTGQSSLAYLKRFPIDAVKIDKSFVFDIDKRASDEWIVTAVLLLAQQLGLRTVAEGVESHAQLAFLSDHGCEEIQGYLISRPLPAAAFEQRFLQTGMAIPLLAFGRSEQG